MKQDYSTNFSPKQSTIDNILRFAEIFPVKKVSEAKSFSKNPYLYQMNETMRLPN